MLPKLQGRNDMRKVILLTAVLGAGIAAYATEASSAVMCARGVHRAGCIGPNGAVMGRRTMGGGAVIRRTTAVGPRRGAVVHRRTVIR